MHTAEENIPLLIGGIFFKYYNIQSTTWCYDSKVAENYGENYGVSSFIITFNMVKLLYIQAIKN